MNEIDLPRFKFLVISTLNILEFDMVNKFENYRLRKINTIKDNGK